jgi:hypothetical protein
MQWTIVSAVATVVSTIAFVISALYVRAELKALEKERYLNVTNQIFSIWQTHEFMAAQMWLMHRLEETDWPEFIEKHRGDYGEAAFHRVGSFYDRVGTLVRMGLIDEKEILSTVGGYAIAVWRKIEPLVHEARRIENSVLFDDFERLLPSCYECYVPALGGQKARTEVQPFSAAQQRHRISQAVLKQRLDRRDPLTLLDVRSDEAFAANPLVLPRARHIAAAEVGERYGELPRGREVIAYCA